MEEQSDHEDGEELNAYSNEEEEQDLEEDQAEVPTILGMQQLMQIRLQPIRETLTTHA